LVTILAIAAAAIQLFISLTRPGLVDSVAHGHTDVTAFLVAAPAFVGALMANWTNVASTVGSSLSAYFGLVLTMAISLVLALCYAWESGGGSHHDFHVTVLGGRALLTLSYVLTPLALFSICLALYLANKAYAEIQYYLSITGAAQTEH
jgi:hypothetical protein